MNMQANKDQLSENEILPAFRDSLFQNCTDLLQDYGEVAIDTILGPNIFSDIPIVSTVTAICKAGLNIKERNYLRQTLAFIKGFHSGTIDNPIDIFNANSHFLDLTSFIDEITIFKKATTNNKNDTILATYTMYA